MKATPVDRWRPFSHLDHTHIRVCVLLQTLSSILRKQSKNHRLPHQRHLPPLRWLLPSRSLQQVETLISQRRLVILSVPTITLAIKQAAVKQLCKYSFSSSFSYTLHSSSSFRLVLSRLLPPTLDRPLDDLNPRTLPMLQKYLELVANLAAKKAHSMQM